MPEALLWWLVLGAGGWLAFPVSYAIFRRLGDGGLSFSKPLFLVSTGYVFWILNSLHLIPNSVIGISIAVTLMAGVSAAMLYRVRSELQCFIRERWLLLLAIEALFASAFVLAAFLRSHVPEVTEAESPMDFAMLNATSRSAHFPPDDPWLSGFSVSYYYFGYLIASMIGRLAGVPESIAFNLALASTAALTVVGAFGIVYNLTAGTEASDRNAKTRWRFPLRPALCGLAAAVILTVTGNLEAILELTAVHRIGSEGFYEWVGIHSLEPRSSTRWYPYGPEHQYFWWRASRIIPIDDIEVFTEFPFFSFVFGDLHPHVMALPFVLLTAAFGLALMRSPDRLDVGFWLRRPLLFVGASVVMGSLGFLSTWDLPTMVLLLSVIAFVHNQARAGPPSAERVLETIGFVVPLLVVAVLAYVPFYASLATMADRLQVVRDTSTRPFHAFLFWGPLAALVVPFVVERLGTLGVRRLGASALALSAGPGMFVVLLWMGRLLHDDGLGGLLGQLEGRGSGWVTIAVTMLFLSATLLATWLEAAREAREDRGRDSRLFVLVAISVAAFLVLAVDFFFVEDPYHIRTNTVFKLYYQAWVLLSLGAGLALYYLMRSSLPRWPVRFGFPFLLRGGWLLATAVLVLAAFVYPVIATLNRTDEFQAPRSLDALSFVAERDPDEYEAIQWLRRGREEPLVIVEAVGPAFDLTGRISGSTGIPTVVGWTDHQVQWRGTDQPMVERAWDIVRIFTTAGPDEIMRLLRKYDADYVYVGRLERQMYGPDVFARFDGLLDIAFESNGVRIYQVPVGRGLGGLTSR